jgi:AcrR family transcriptional regulator
MVGAALIRFVSADSWGLLGSRGACVLAEDEGIVSYATGTAAPRLRSGRNGLTRPRVTEIQRGRMLSAAVEVVEELGYSRMTVAQVIDRAGVSRKTFYDFFADREDCFLAAFDQAITQARIRAIERYELEPGWREAIRSALATVLLFIDEEPALARLFIVEALGAGERVLDRRSRLLGELADVVDRGRLATSATRHAPEITAEAVIGAIFAVLHKHVLEGRKESATDLLGPLMSVIVLPYLGAGPAGRELNRPPIGQGRRARGPARGNDPLEGLNVRLTYRTVRVLMTLAEHPGASNRETAAGSGIVDPGQISKLLTRLARLSLIENGGESQAKTRPNAWHLTPRGARLERAVRLG